MRASADCAGARPEIRRAGSLRLRVAELGCHCAMCRRGARGKHGALAGIYWPVKGRGDAGGPCHLHTLLVALGMGWGWFTDRPVSATLVAGGLVAVPDL